MSNPPTIEQTLVHQSQSPRERFEDLVRGSNSVMLNHSWFCMEFSPDETEEGGFYDNITVDDADFEIDFTPEAMDSVTVDENGVWTIGDLVLEFFELTKIVN